MGWIPGCFVRQICAAVGASGLLANLGWRRRQHPAPIAANCADYVNIAPRSGKRGRISIEEMKRNTDYPGFGERVDFVRAEAKRRGKVVARSKCGDPDLRRYRILSPHRKALAAFSPTNTIPDSKDFIGLLIQLHIDEIN
jgi:hypothetical protein